MSLDNAKIDLADLVRAYPARVLCGVATNSILELNAEKLGKITIGGNCFWSAKACRQYREDRPDILKCRDVAEILKCSRQNVTDYLDRYLRPTMVSWGGWLRVRSYDRDRVAELQRLREADLAATGHRNVRPHAYASMLDESTTAPSSVGLAPTVIGKTGGSAPRQVTKPKGNKSARVAEQTERVKSTAVNAIDARKRRG